MSYKKINFIFNALQITISGVVLFFLYKIVLLKLHIEVAGVWGLLLSTALIVNLANFGLSTSITKYAAEYIVKENFNELAILVKSTLLIIIISSLITILCMPIIKENVLELIPLSVRIIYQDNFIMALIYGFFSSLSLYFQNLLDAMNKIVQKNILIVFSQIILIFIAIYGIDDYGLKAIIFGQLIQLLIIVIFSFIFFLSIYKDFFINSKINFIIIRRMLKFTFGTYLISITQLAMEPLIKVFFVMYGSVAGVALFDMAFKMLMQVRQVVAYTNQALIPLIVHYHSNNKMRAVQIIYEQNLKIVMYASNIIFPMIILLLPSISMSWIGYIDNHFIIFSLLIILGIVINIMTIPAYFFFYSTGQVKINLQSHVLSAFFNILLCYTFGNFFNDYGIVTAWSVSSIIGSFYLIVKFHMVQNINFSIFKSTISNILLWYIIGCIFMMVNFYYYSYVLIIFSFVLLGFIMNKFTNKKISFYTFQNLKGEV